MSWISFMFIPDSHSLVAKVCLRLWLLKLGKRTGGFSHFKNSVSLQSRIIRLYTLFSVPWVCRPPKRLRKTKSVYPSMVIGVPVQPWTMPGVSWCPFNGIALVPLPRDLTDSCRSTHHPRQFGTPGVGLSALLQWSPLSSGAHQQDD